MIAGLINQIPNIDRLSYLELGVGNRRNFDAVRCQSKTSVDTNGRGTYTVTTDEFFERLDSNRMFDVIFIDANHDIQFVLRDFNNSVEHCRKWVLIHDTIPPSKKFTQSRYCSDSYRLLYYLWMERIFKFYPMSNNFGLTFVKMPARRILDTDLFDVTYEEFTRKALSERLYDETEIVRMLSM